MKMNVEKGNKKIQFFAKVIKFYDTPLKYSKISPMTHSINVITKYIYKKLSSKIQSPSKKSHTLKMLAYILIT